MRFLPFVLLAAAQLASAGVLTFADRPSFNAVAPAGLTLETFENGTLADGLGADIGTTLDANSNNAVFAPGAIAPGLRLTDSQGLFVGNHRNHFPTISVMNDAEGDPIGITFPATQITALAFDYYGIFFENGLSQVTLYDAANNELWTGSTAPPGTGVFFGFLSSTPIARVVLSNGIAWYGVDNIAFGDTTPVPEPATVLLTGLALVTLTLHSPRHWR
jgi:hypothetical protein